MFFQHLELKKHMVTEQERRLSRKEKRKLKKKEGENNSVKLNFDLRTIKPLTENQAEVFNLYDRGKNLFLHGCPGSGKSFLSLYLATKELLEKRTYSKIIIVRSAEPSKNVGFLPGSLKEKTKVLEEPYQGIFTELFNRGDAYDYLKNKGVVEFISTSYIRGITLDNCCIVVDECQNLQFSELFGIMTRIGNNSRIIFCGDYNQSDLNPRFRDDNRKEDIKHFREIIRRMPNLFGDVQFEDEDIVRSSLVKQFIIAADQLGYI